jgi:hypothetical protein
MSFTLTKKFNDNTFHISITKNNKYYETTLKNITKEYYDNTLSKFDVDTVNIIDMKESLLVNYDSESIELNEILVSYIEYMELKKKLEIMEKQITKVSYHEMIESIVFKRYHVYDSEYRENEDIRINSISTIINMDINIHDIRAMLNTVHGNLFQDYYLSFGGNTSDINYIEKAFMNPQFIKKEIKEINLTREQFIIFGKMINSLKTKDLESLNIKIIKQKKIRRQINDNDPNFPKFSCIMIPPGKMMKVYETNNTKDYTVYHSGVYDGDIIKKGRMLWVGFVERQHDVPDNIEI